MDCIKASGREFEFMNMLAATAKALEEEGIGTS